MSVRASLVAALTLAACNAEPQDYLIVTVTDRPGVHDVAELRITLANAGSMRTDELPLRGAKFPLTFSISAPDRTGPLDITVDALDSEQLVVGRGVASSTIDAETASVQLDTTDFVVNTDFAEDQFPSDDYEAHGLQLASADDGTWTVAYRGACGGPCNMFARRFDTSGRPVSTRVAAGTNGFPVSTVPTTGLSIPAAATSGNTTLVVWDYAEPDPGVGEGIACRALDAEGNAIASQRLLATDPGADVVAIAPLSNSNFALSWTAFLGNTTVIRSVIAKPDCTTLAPAVNVSTVDGTSVRKAAVASSGLPTRVLYAWIVDGSVRVRIADPANAFLITDTEFLPRTANEIVEAVRVAPLGMGFAIIVRWVQAAGVTGPGRLELFRTNAMGAVLGAPILVSNKSGSDFASSEAFGAATSSAGELMVTWHSCVENGDGNGCGVWARAFDSAGMPQGPEFGVPTTTVGDQTGPSVAPVGNAWAFVWRDASATAPDISGTAVRARIVY